MSPQWRGYVNDGGSALASPHACCFVPWLLLCDGQRCPCFLLVAMLLRCFALPPYPRRTNGPASVAVANANALQLPLPPKPGCPVSPVLWVLRHAVGHLRQPWDPRDRARQEPPVGARCPVTPVDGTISGYDYDYDYIYIYIYYYTPLPLNLANKQASNKQATSNKQQATSTSPFRFGHCSASSLRALLYSSHPRA